MRPWRARAQSPDALQGRVDTWEELEQRLRDGGVLILLLAPWSGRLLLARVRQGSQYLSCAVRLWPLLVRRGRFRITSTSRLGGLEVLCVEETRPTSS